MSGPDLRAKLFEFVNADNQEATQAILEKYANDLLSDETDTELARWIEEVNDQPEMSAKLVACQEMLRLVRATRNMSPMETLFTLFMRVQDSQQLAQLVQPLTEQAVNNLVQYAEQKLTETTGDEAEGIRQRLQGLRQIRSTAQNPLHQGLMQFLQVESDNEARAVLLAQPDLLLTLDAERVLNMFQGGNPESQAHLDTRKTLWWQVRQERIAPVSRHSETETVPLSPDSEHDMPLQTQLASGMLSQQGETYTIIGASNCAIGPGAMTINNVGRIPLEWKRPQETRASLATGAVGREIDLNDLHQRLKRQSTTVVVGIRGQAGIGKTVLAAMYATRYEAQYPGGVLWLQLNPSLRTEISVNPLLNRIATYAYRADAQAQEMLRNAQFSPETVQMLLAGHGNLLVVIDDVWDQAVLKPLWDAIPNDASILVTTRDYDVALVASGGEDAVKQLDVLTPADARLLLQTKVTGLDASLADELAGKLGYHAQALSLAAGALSRRGRGRHTATVQEIARRVRQGEGFGDLPRMDKRDRVSPVEVALRYSYDYLGEQADGNQLQRRFRALGAFVEGAAFDQPAVAALWESAEPEECLLMFDNLALITEVSQPDSGSGSRWQQHAILRAYALSLQDGPERLTFPQRHAEYYLDQMRAANNAQRYYVMAPELPNLRHAFEWAVCESLDLAQAYVGNCANLLRSQNMGLEYLAWAEKVLARARLVGDDHTRGRALGTYGNALQAAATVIRGEDRGARLREALVAYDAALPLLSDVPLDQAQTLNNRATVYSDLATVQGEDRRARLLQALADYDAALPLRRDVPLDKAQTLNNQANVYRDLATVQGEDRRARLLQALADFDAALPLRRDVPLDKAQTLNNRATVYSALATVQGEDRRARLLQALADCDAALPLRRDVPLDQATTLNNRANVYSALATVQGEDRRARLLQALADYDAALPLLSDVPLDQATTLNNRATVYSALATVQGEDRRARLLQALADYDAALPLRRDVPLDQATTLNNRANVYSDLATVQGEDRRARLLQALADYDAALPLLSDVPLDQATTLNNRANVYSALATVQGEDRRARLLQALADCDAALPLLSDVPLDKAQTLNNRANVYRDLATVQGEDRRARLLQALADYDAALPLLSDVPLDQATTLNNRANVYSDLATVQGEDRRARLLQALADYDAALPLRRDVPLDQAQTLNNRATVYSDLATVQGEDRRARLLQALTDFDAALPLRRDVPLDKAQTLNNQANVYSALATVQGEDRRARLLQALADYDAALPLLSDVPLDQATTLNNRATVYSDLATVQGEDRRARLLQALADFDVALPLLSDVPLDYAATQGNLGNLYTDLEDYEKALTAMWTAAQGFEQVGHLPYINQSRSILIRFKHERGALFDTLWAAVVGGAQPDWLEAAPVDAAQAAVLQERANLLVAWIQTPDWDASEAYLREHEADLLTEEGEAALHLLRQANPGNKLIEQHIALLRQAVNEGIEAAYAPFKQAVDLNSEEAQELLFGDFMSVQNGQQLAELVQQLPAQALDHLEQIAEFKLSEATGDEAEGIRQRLQGLRQIRSTAQNPLHQGLMQFFQADSDDKARTLLLAQPDLLLTLDAERVLNSFTGGDPETQARIDARKVLWHQVQLERAAPALRHARHTTTAQEDALDTPTTTRSSEDALTRREDTYTVINSSNFAIGPGAMVINNVGRIPLEWKAPWEFQAPLSAGAVGRVDELAELHESLQAQSSVGIVGKGAAVQGSPGIGKSTLAALYVEQYAANYDGILWVRLGPDARSEASANPHLNRIATYAYNADAQAQEMLKNAQFSAETVQALLSEHGRLLLVIDDAWDYDAVKPFRQALPANGCLLVTTRDARIANQSGKKIELDVLKEEDALTLIVESLPDMPADQQRRLARAVGYHPLALAVAIGDLTNYGPDEWDGLITTIAAMVQNGEGFGDLPLMDQLDRESRVEAVLRFSTDAMARLTDGEEYLRRFKALGSFAQEADFDTAAATAVFGDDESAARAYLNVFVARALLKRMQNGRWQQHAILRAYALGLQDGPERLTFPQRHAEYYLDQMRAADNAQRYYVMAPELPNLRHAFEWAVRESLDLAQAYVGNCANLLCSQNMGLEYLAWAEKVLARARLVGDDRTRGRALGTYGNALQAAATVIRGEDRGARLREALVDYDAALPLLSDVPLDQATTLNNRANVYSDLATVQGEDRRARLLQALADYDAALPLLSDVPLDKATTLNNRAVLLSALASLPGEDRGARLREALVAYDETLELRREVPLDYAQTQNNRAVLLRALASLPGEDRDARLREALAAYDEALDNLREVPLDYATTQNNRAVLLRALASLPGEDRGARLREALTAYDEALDNLREVPLDYATTQNNRAVLLSALASLPGEDRDARLREALAAYDEALELRREVPLAYATTQNNRATVYRDLATVQGEDRRARLLQALADYDAALPLRRDVPLDKAATLNNRANVYSDLATVQGEDRRARLLQALADYDAALPLRRDVPLDQAQTLNNRATVYRALATVQGEDRRARLLQALADYDAALPLQRDVPLDYAMTQGNLGNLYTDLEDYEKALTAMWTAAQGFEQVGHLPYINQSRSILIRFKHERGALFDTLWTAVVGSPQPDWLQATPVDAAQAAMLQERANLLVAWIRTPDWGASEAYLREHQADLLTDEGEAALHLLLQANPGNETIEQHIALLGQAVNEGIEAAYAQHAQPSDPVLAAVQALFTQVRDEDTFRAVIEQHPALTQLPALTILAEGVERAHAEEQSQAAMGPLVLLLPLLGRYNADHAENIDPAEYTTFVDIHTRLLPAAEAINEPLLLQGLKELLAQALNTLGNYYADTGQHSEAITIYTRAIEQTPTQATYYRNRAGGYLELKDFAHVQTDLDKAQELEPEAQRLPTLWRDLYLAQGNGAAMLPHTIILRDRKPDDADGHYYVALALGLDGQMDQALEAMRESSRRASEQQRAQELTTLEKLMDEHPEHAGTFTRLSEILKEPSSD